MLSLQQGTTIKGILREDLKKFKCILPPKNEQLKISNILNNIINNININIKKRAKLILLKTGLMQVLLSGKIRVELREDGLHRIGNN